MSSEETIYDVLIVGGGPAAMAMLAALREPLNAVSEDKFRNKENVSVCVLDPSGKWLNEWRGRFRALRIKYLRSPLWAHPFQDRSSLMDFAWSEGRREQIFSQTDDLLSTSIARDLGSGLFDWAGSSLFNDFCERNVQRLEHDFIQAEVHDIAYCGKNRVYSIKTNENVSSQLSAKQVILAVGAGSPRIPPVFEEDHKLHQNIIHTNEWQKLIDLKIISSDIVLVVGGGTSAVQAALLAKDRGAAKVILCTRRPLAARHYELPINWLDYRASSKSSRCRLFEFYGTPVNERLLWVQKERGGASVPPKYIHQLSKKSIHVLVDHVSEVNYLPKEQLYRLSFVGSSQHTYVSKIILGTGTDFSQNNLVHKLADRFQLPLISGLPALNHSLQWGNMFYVVGALAALQVGPDAANLMGIKRAAEICADSLGAYDGGQENKEAALSTNPYDQLLLDDSSASDSDSDSCSSSVDGEFGEQ